MSLKHFSSVVTVIRFLETTDNHQSYKVSWWLSLVSGHHQNQCVFKFSARSTFAFSQFVFKWERSKENDKWNYRSYYTSFRRRFSINMLFVYSICTKYIRFNDLYIGFELLNRFRSFSHNQSHLLTKKLHLMPCHSIE